MGSWTDPTTRKRKVTPFLLLESLGMWLPVLGAPGRRCFAALGAPEGVLCSGRGGRLPRAGWQATRSEFGDLPPASPGRSPAGPSALPLQPASRPSRPGLGPGSSTAPPPARPTEVGLARFAAPERPGSVGGGRRLRFTGQAPIRACGMSLPSNRQAGRRAATGWAAVRAAGRSRPRVPRPEGRLGPGRRRAARRSRPCRVCRAVAPVPAEARSVASAPAFRRAASRSKRRRIRPGLSPRRPPKQAAPPAAQVAAPATAGKPAASGAASPVPSTRPRRRRSSCRSRSQPFRASPPRGRAAVRPARMQVRWSLQGVAPVGVCGGRSRRAPHWSWDVLQSISGSVPARCGLRRSTFGLQRPQQAAGTWPLASSRGRLGRLRNGSDTSVSRGLTLSL